MRGSDKGKILKLGFSFSSGESCFSYIFTKYESKQREEKHGECLKRIDV